MTELDVVSHKLSTLGSRSGPAEHPNFGLGPQYFVDDVQPEMLSKITKLAKMYPATYRIYLAGRDI